MYIDISVFCCCFFVNVSYPAIVHVSTFDKEEIKNIKRIYSKIINFEN